MRPIDDDERDQVRALHAAGHGRNAISRTTGIPQYRVSAIAADMGLTFKRAAHTAEAAAAKVVDGQARRAALSAQLLVDAERLRQQLWQPCTVYNFGGRDNTYETATLPEPDFAAKNAIMRSVGLCVDKSLRLDEYDSGANLHQVVSLLETLGNGLVAKWGTTPADPA